MTKLIVDLKSLENIDKYQVDGLIISMENFSCYNDRCFNDDEIRRIVEYCKPNNILTILNIDRIFEEAELDFLYQRLDEYLELDIDYYIYGDFAVLAYFINKKITNKLIYDPKTLIANIEDARIHHQYNSLVVVSNELTLDEISTIATIGNTVVEVYGYHQMFYSKRRILSTYADFLKTDKILDDKLLNIKEEIRFDLYPIFQSKNGTFVYTNYRYCMFKELVEIMDKLPLVKINSMFIDEDELIKIISVYQKLLSNEKPNTDDLYQQLTAINSNISSGFLYNKSFLLKE